MQKRRVVSRMHLAVNMNRFFLYTIQFDFKYHLTNLLIYCSTNLHYMYNQTFFGVVESDNNQLLIYFTVLNKLETSSISNII